MVEDEKIPEIGYWERARDTTVAFASRDKLRNPLSPSSKS